MSKDTLTQEEIKRGLSNVLKDGLTSQIMANLITGTFLISFALTLGAPTLIIGILATIPAICQLSQIFGIFLVEKIRKRKIITFCFLLFYRISILLVALIPYIFQTELYIFVFILFITLRYLFASIGHTAWSSWMNDLIPKNQLGRFFGKRQFISSIFILFTSFIAANFLEFWKTSLLGPELVSYSILFFIAFLFGMISIFFIYKIPEPNMNLRENKLKLSKILLSHFKERNFRYLIGFLTLWSLASNLIAPFFVVYLLTNLNLSLSQVMFLTIISQIANLLSFKIWGSLADNYSNKTVFKLCCPLFLISLFLFSITLLINYNLILMSILILIYLIIGISTSGIVLSTGNISFKLTPKEEGTSFLAITTIITSISLGIAPIIGAILFEMLIELEFHLGTNILPFSFTLNGIFLLFFIAIIIGLFSIVFLLKISEKGDIRSKRLFRHFVIRIKNSLSYLSLSNGFKDILIYPSLYLTYRALKKKRKNCRKSHSSSS